MILNEIKCHVDTSLGLVGGMHPLHVPLCPRLTWSLQLLLLSLQQFTPVEYEFSSRIHKQKSVTYARFKFINSPSYSNSKINTKMLIAGFQSASLLLTVKTSRRSRILERFSSNRSFVAEELADKITQQQHFSNDWSGGIRRLCTEACHYVATRS